MVVCSTGDTAGSRAEVTGKGVTQVPARTGAGGAILIMPYRREMSNDFLLDRRTPVRHNKSMTNVILKKESPTTAALIVDDPALRWTAAEALTYPVKGAKYDPRVRAGIWDGRTCLLTKEGKFPAGLISRVRDVYHEQKIPVTVVDPFEIKRAEITADSYPYMWDHARGTLRDYQDTAVNAAFNAGSGIVWMGTGTGKSLVIAALTAMIGAPTLVIVPTKDLLYQMATTLREWLPDVEIGLLGDGNHQWSPEVTVATFQTLARHRDGLWDELQSVQVVISDEGHHVPAKTWQQTLGSIPALYRYVFSATPFTGAGEDLVLEGTVGPVVFTYRGSEAIAGGTLVQPHVWMLECSTPVFPQTDAWSDIYQAGIVDNQERNDKLIEATCVAASEWGKTLVIVRSIAHGAYLTERIAAAGINVAFAQGNTSADMRRRLLRGFAGAQYDVMVSTSIFDEGVDVPIISAITLAAGGRADHKTIQRVGRGMRQGGQSKLLVIDTFDTGEHILARHARARRSLYQRERWPVEVIR